MSQTNHGITIHVVFSTKLRSPVLHDDWRDELFAYIGGTVREHKAVLLAAGGIEDHVHLLLKNNVDSNVPLGKRDVLP